MQFLLDSWHSSNEGGDVLNINVITGIEIKCEIDTGSMYEMANDS